MKDKLLQIINHYGINNQQRKLQEEVFELQEAIYDYQSGTYLSDTTYAEDEKIAINHIAEEITDVIVMLKQFQYYYEITNKEIEGIMKYKIDRQLERIENERIN